MSLILALLMLPQEELYGKLVQVTPGEALHFRDVPAAPPRKAYVMPGDVLVADGETGGFTAVTFVSPTGKASSGFLWSARLRALPSPAPNWAGTWRFGDATIVIRPGKARGMLQVRGETTWGGHDPERVRNGGVHLGDFLGEVRPRRDRLAYADARAGCRVRMRLLGPYLLVGDNGGCGGANVTFSGTYRR